MSIAIYSKKKASYLAKNQLSAPVFHARSPLRAMASAERRIPRDAAVVINVLRSMGVEEWEPRVVNQLMEFVHRKFESESIGFRVFSARRRHSRLIASHDRTPRTTS